MILITGMPRSGTSFMQWIFDTYGPKMVPKLYSKVAFNPAFAYNLSEPSVVGKLCYQGANRQAFSRALTSIENQWKDKSNNSELVIKLPQLCFFPGVCSEFSKIIVCVSEVDDRYEKSGKAQNLGGWLNDSNVHFLKPLNDRTLKGLSYFWRKKSFELLNHYPDKTEKYEFGSKTDFDRIFLKYMSQGLVDEAYKQHWRGSRFLKGFYNGLESFV